MINNFLRDKHNHIQRHFLYYNSCIYSKQNKHRPQCRLLMLLQPRQQKLCNNIHTYFYVQIKLFLLILLHQYFHHILLPVYLPTFFYTCNFHNLHTHQNDTIYHNHAHNYWNSKHILYIIDLYQSILYIRIDIYHHSNAVYYYKHLHPICIYTYTFHAILYAFFH